MRKIIIFVFILVLLSCGVLLGLGYFPITRAAGTIIWYHDVSQALAILNTTQKISGNPGASPESDTRRAVLEELITRSIIKSSLRDFGLKEINDEIQSNIQEILAKVDLDKLNQAIKNAYGLSFAEFKDRVILPQVEEVVLEKYVRLAGKDYNTWLKEKLKQADVKIYVLPYKWENAQLQSK